MNLISMKIPSKVSTIETYSFSGCLSLSSVFLPESVTSIKNFAFEECQSLSSLTLPSKLTSIGIRTFSGCTSLTSVYIPSKVKTIGGDPFIECSNLESIDVDPANKYFQSLDGALIDKSKHKLLECPPGKGGKFVIPSSITSIQYYAFWNCKGLTSIVILGNMKLIDDYAFYGCSNLLSITYLGSSDPGLPQMDPFKYCNSLGVICVSESFKSNTFCGKNITCKSCNQCFYLVENTTECIVRKKKEADIWEDQSNGCMLFQCHNKSGLIATSQCKNDAGNTTVCVNDKCVEKQQEIISEKQWVIEITLNNTESYSITSNDIASEISNKSGIDIEDLTIGVEYDGDGKVTRILVYVNDKSNADIISSSVKCSNGEEGCNDITCRCTSVNVRENTPSLSIVSLSCYHSSNLMMMMFSLLLIFLMH